MRKSRPIEERFWAKVNKDGPVHPVLGTKCWVWTGGTNERGYGVLGRRGKGDGFVKAHRLGYCLGNGLEEADLGTALVLHRCDNPACVRAEHLELGTQADNMRQMASRGRARPKRGSENPCSKLSDEQVLEIRRLYTPGEFGAKRLAKKFSVCDKTIRKILAREKWGHL